MVKRGFRSHIDPQVCGVSFDSLPAWLWAIRLADWSAILITDTDEARLRQYHVSTWTHVQGKLVVVPSLRLMASSVEAVVWFGSGRKEGSDRLGHSIDPSVPVCFWLVNASRRCPPSSTNWRWRSIDHGRMGGSTTVRGVFGFRGIDPPVLSCDPIRRTIAHFLKHSERPRPCSIDLKKAHYSIHDQLSVHLMKRPVLFATGFSYTGWGERELIPTEFSQAFDLPNFIPWSDEFWHQLVPIQLFRIAIDSILSSLQPDHDGPPATRPRLQVYVPSDISIPDRVWLPSLNLWLPGTWTDIEIAGRAVKADCAAVNFAPWNRRISLVLPCSPRSITSFERFAMSRWRRCLFHSFISYLHNEYGSDWSTLHTSICRRGFVSTVGRKRGRVASKYLSSPHKVGGNYQNLEDAGMEANASGTEKEKNRDLVEDVKKGRAILDQVLRSEWWEWTFGSSLFFWRWNGSEQRHAARDGMRIFVQAPLPQGRKEAKLNLDDHHLSLVAGKMDTLLCRRYLESGFVTNTVPFFAVPKGDDDIRVVFDGTSCGLNETLWSPNFFLPSAKSASMHLTTSTWMSDVDFGEMFHNFPMDERIRKCAGVRLGNVKRFLNESTCGRRPDSEFVRWSRLFMGMKPSPYNAVRHYYWGEEFARGNPARRNNPMGYDTVRLNMPGMEEYDPSMPKVMKWSSDANNGKGAVCGDVVTFVDDVRVTGYSKENCHLVHRQFSSRIQFLGMQDAPRKFRPPSQSEAGAWTGTIFKIADGMISKSVSQDKWNKGISIVSGLLSLCDQSDDKRPLVDRKSLEKETGFLNHLAMTFGRITPFLKGFYLTLNSWRDQRDESDWKVPDKRWKLLLFSRFEANLISEEVLDNLLNGNDVKHAPRMVKASNRLRSDLDALMRILFSHSDSPLVRIRSNKLVTVVYGFGDASGTGLGATFTCGSGFNFRIGVWGGEEDPESSNWKEFANIVEALEDEAEAGNLSDSEVFMFTDNSTVESCAEKGSSSSPKLLELVIRLHALGMKIGSKIQVFHVAGTRMIAQGTDGVSRGYLSQGVMAGEAMSAHIPIHLSAVDRGLPNLVPWIRSWGGSDAILLDPMGWYESGHDVEGWDKGWDNFERPRLSSERRTYIWAPPPYVAEVAVAQLRIARIKRQQSAHIFVCPRLCTTLWQKQLYKAADFVFEVPVGYSCWPSELHEPLLIGVCFPFISVKPWQLRRSPKMFAVGRELRQVFDNPEMDAGDFLRQFWILCINLGTMPEHLVRKVLLFKR